MQMGRKRSSWTTALELHADNAESRFSSFSYFPCSYESGNKFLYILHEEQPHNGCSAHMKRFLYENKYFGCTYNAI